MRKLSDYGLVRTFKRRIGGIRAGSKYAYELVNPILTYREDIETLQDIVRRLHKAGGTTNNSCGIHIHLHGAPHTKIHP